MFSKLKNIKLTQKQQTIIFLFSIFIIMLILNIFTPLIADDYNYKYIYGTNHKVLVENILDVFISQYNHYMLWGGRTVAHLIAQTFLIFPKTVFDIFNAACYTSIIYLIYYLATEKRDKPYLIITIHLLLWFFIPYFGEDFLWLIGSCNYSWTLLIMLSFLAIYKRNKLKNNKKNIFLMLLYGIIVGWTNENTAFGLIIIIASWIIIEKNKNKKLNKWKISGLIGSIIGFIILIVAPGNYVRKAKMDIEGSIIINWIKRFIDCTEGVRDYLLPLIIIILILISYYRYKNKKVNIKIFSYILGSFISVYAMVLSPQFPIRAWLGIIVFLIIPCIILFDKILLPHHIFKYVFIDGIVILSFIAILDSYQLTLDLKHYGDALKYREEYIEKYKKEKNTFEFQSYVINNKRTPFHGPDLTSDKNNWLNEAQARHFGVKYLIGY